MTLLSVRGVSRRYGEVVALDGVDLDVPVLGRTAIVGASGSGKSTLLRLIGGFERPDGGSIAMADDVLASASVFVPAHRRGIGYVSQDGALFPHLSVAANVAFGLPRRTPDRDLRVGDLLDLVQVDRGMAARRPHELSGGQQQRVALARALAMRPKLILLDEPFSALDAGLRETLRRAVADVLAAAKVTTILVTHDQAEALSFASHLAVLRAGRLVQAGPPQELYRAPRDPAIAEFLGDALVLPAELGDGWAECRLGRIAADTAGRRGRGTILLRPEQLVLDPAEPRGGEAEALVTDVAFAGPFSMVRVCLPARGGEELSRSLTCRVGGVTPAPGTTVILRALGAAHVFPG